MVAAGALIEHLPTHTILLVQRTHTLDWRPGEWEITYGRIAQHEDLETGLRREVMEEVGITDLNVGQVIRTWHIYRGPVSVENDLIGVTFHCTTNTQTARISDEHEQYKWVTIEEALQLVKSEGILEDLKRFVNTKRVM